MQETSDTPNTPDVPEIDVYRPLYEHAQGLLRDELREALQPTSPGYETPKIVSATRICSAITALAAIEKILPPPAPSATTKTLDVSEFNYLTDVVDKARTVATEYHYLLGIDPGFFDGRYENIGLALSDLAEVIG